VSFAAAADATRTLPLPFASLLATGMMACGALRAIGAIPGDRPPRGYGTRGADRRMLCNASDDGVARSQTHVQDPLSLRMGCAGVRRGDEICPPHQDLARSTGMTLRRHPSGPARVCIGAVHCAGKILLVAASTISITAPNTCATCASSAVLDIALRPATAIV